LFMSLVDLSICRLRTATLNSTTANYFAISQPPRPTFVSQDLILLLLLLCYVECFKTVLRAITR
jgi:hypothetical protein